MYKDHTKSADAQRPNDRMVLLVPSEAVPVEARRGIDYEELWRVLWEGRWLIVGITAAFAILSIVYALAATQWWRAEAVLMPAKPRQGLSAQLGNLAGLAGMAGLNIGEAKDNEEALAVLRSRDFTRAFIEEKNLLPVLFADDWDSQSGRWKKSDPDKQRDVRDGVKYFANRILRVAENKKTGLVTLSVEWKDKRAVAEWANLLVVRANDRMRQRALVEAEANVKFLREELNATTVVTLQQSISRLLERELETLMLARGNKEFAFRVVDRATIPKWRSSPKRALVAILATMGGGMVSLLVVFARNGLRRRRAVAQGGTAPSHS